MENEKMPIYSRNWFIVLFLIILWPIGIFLMWACSNWKKQTKIILTILIALIVIALIIKNALLMV